MKNKKNSSLHLVYILAKQQGNLRFGRPSKPNIKFIDKKKEANKNFCRNSTDIV